MKIAAGLLIILAGILTAMGWMAYTASVPDYKNRSWGDASVGFDPYGFSTIDAKDWNSALKMQGNVVASERLFQMDLIRRQTAGRLSELFGEKALNHDKKMRQEDREGLAKRSVERLPQRQLQACNSYADGVNEFIAKNPGKWGVEYTILRTSPESWTCKDTLLVLLAMTDMLTSTSPKELVRGLWSMHLPEDWTEFLFTYEHPWNEPLFGEKSTLGVHFPKISNWIAPRSLEKKQSQVIGDSDAAPGSNGWAWSGDTGVWLANDTHLGQVVPGTWYGQRLRISNGRWVVGVTIPGIPGIVIGMNNDFAWGFTNTGEDVDDLVEERLSDDGTKWLAEIVDGKEIWEPIEIRHSEIRVKGKDSIKTSDRWTRRGPLVEFQTAKGKVFSRQWLGLREGLIQLPTEDLNLATSWEEFNQALDSMTIPAQNVMYADRVGNLGYRVSGTGVIRKEGHSGRIPVAGFTGEWQGLAPASSRLRKFLPSKSESVQSIVTANQRIWIDGHGHDWYGEDRSQAIKDRLAAKGKFSAEEMLDIQLDTRSRFRKMLLDWVVERGTPTTPEQENLLSRWQQWNGDAVSDVKTFSESIHVDSEFTRVLVGRVRETFLPHTTSDFEYRWSLKRAWQIAVLEHPDSMQMFGLQDKEVANHLLQYAALKSSEASYETLNRWKAQHPFVDNIPVIGKLFSVLEPDQYGFADLARAESPKFGPAMRLVWDLKDQANSRWILPVGQSGHPASPHWNDQQKHWHAGKILLVFPKDADWSFQ
jgi:penicillin amidase